MSLDSPHLVMGRLEQIEEELASKQNEVEDAAMEYARKKRDYEREYATAFLGADGNVEERRQRARLAVKCDLAYAEAQGRYEGLKAYVRVLETRASVGQSVLRSQVRQG